MIPLIHEKLVIMNNLQIISAISMLTNTKVYISRGRKIHYIHLKGTPGSKKVMLFLNNSVHSIPNTKNWPKPWIYVR